MKKILLNLAKSYQKLVYSNFKQLRGVTRGKMFFRSLATNITEFEVIDVEGSKIFGNSSIGQFADLLIFGYVEELQYMKFLDSELSPESSFLDIGANYGLWASYFDDRVNKVVAVEPNPEGRSFLSFNKTYFNRNFEIKDFALGNKESTVDFYLEDSSAGHASLEAEHNNAIKIKQKTADSQFSDFDAAKIDVEGGEFRVLKGASQILEDLEVLVLELHSQELLDKFGASKKGIIEYIQKKDFEIYTLENGSKIDFEIQEGDQRLVCLKNE